MDNNERILFETYFQITGYKGKEIDISYLQLIINILLNSKELEIGELFEETNHNISRFTTYSNSNKFSRTNIKKEDFNKAENFIEETTKLIKQKRRG